MSDYYIMAEESSSVEEFITAIRNYEALNGSKPRPKDDDDFLNWVNEIFEDAKSLKLED